MLNQGPWLDLEYWTLVHAGDGARAERLTAPRRGRRVSLAPPEPPPGRPTPMRKSYLAQPPRTLAPTPGPTRFIGARAMNKSDFAAQIAARASLLRSRAGNVVNAAFDCITDALAGGERVTIAGFGTFSTRSRPARRGRTPRTGEPIDVAASTAPTFKPGKIVRDAVDRARMTIRPRSATSGLLDSRSRQHRHPWLDPRVPSNGSEDPMARPFPNRARRPPRRHPPRHRSSVPRAREGRHSGHRSRFDPELAPRSCQ